MPVSRPLIALLGATVVFFALWTVALKPSSSHSGAASSGVGAYQPAINKAHQVQKLVNGAGARDGGTPATTAPASPTTTTPGTATTATTATTTATTATTATTPAGTATTHTTTANPAAGSAQAHSAPAPHPATMASAAGSGSVIGRISPAPMALSAPTGFQLVKSALEQHKVVAVLFYNPAAADDRAVAHEMSSIPTRGGQVVKVSVPLQQLSEYSALLDQVPVNYSPTLVLIDRAGQAQEIAGYADPFEIDQRVTGALQTSP